jgi:homocitrate synthase NifV
VSDKTIWLTDTTLRDGEQGCGIALGVDEKVRLAQLLDDAGFSIIEAGIPAMGVYEKDTVCRIMDIRKKAKIAVWNRMRREDITHSIDCAPDIIHISAPVSELLIYAMLKKDRAWVRKTLTDCVAYARDRDFDVTVGFQDASRADTAYMASLANEMNGLGVKAIRLADTVGILTPAQARRLLEKMSSETDMPFGIHTHNDLGMATAVAVEAVKGGAVYVDTTLFGIGERAGNCDSYKFIAHGQNRFRIEPDLKELEVLHSSAESILFPDEKPNRWTG